MNKSKSVFKDARLDKRLDYILEHLQSKLGASIPQAAGNFHQAKAIYRFWDNEKVTTEGVLSKHISETQEKCLKEEVVLSIQDTTELDFSNHKQTIGLGYLEKKYQLGIKLHTAIAVSGEGLPLGILQEQYWERPLEQFGKKKDRKKRPIEAKESYRWVDFQNKINQELKEVKKLIHITDREGDIFDFLSAERSSNQHILLRIVQDRVILDEAHRIKSYLNNLPEMGRITVSIGRRGSAAPRQAELQIRYGTVKVKSPLNQKNISKSSEITLQVIKASELDCEDEERIEWYLATTLELDSISEVERCLQYYCHRWLIERFHYILKSGCKLEDLQLSSSEKLEKASATYNILAMRILEMTYLARIQPELNAEAVFSRDEIVLLQKKYSKKLKNKELTLMDAIILVAMLGGFMGRKSDGMPGLKTIWRGMFALEMMVEGLNIARETLAELSFNNNQNNST